MQQYNKKKILAVCLIAVSLFTLALPWIKITGINKSYIDTLSGYMGIGSMMGEVDTEDARAATDLVNVIQDLGVSPLEAFSFLIKYVSFGQLAEVQSSDYGSGSGMIVGCILFELLFLLTLLAGIYALVCVLKGKPLIGKMKGTVFTFLMILLGAVMAYVAIYAGSWLRENSAELIMPNLGVRPALWILLGILTALPFTVWDKALANIPGWQGANTGTGTQGRAPAHEWGPIPGTQGRAPAHEWVCSNCGYVNAPDASFCTKCGCKKGEKKNPQQRRWRCKKCGFMNPGNAATCQACGAPKGWKPPVPQDWRCNFCGFENPESTGTCQRCGHQKGWKPSPDPNPLPPNPNPVPPKPIPRRPPADDPFEAHYLLRVTRDEARSGCEKQFKHKGEIISVVVPTGSNEDTVIIVPQKGRYDSKHDRYGDLRVQLIIH